uniref:Uncharacterized protein n=1 Tax=Aegilops tauschii TaxID=37682 RepID=R7W5G0_AEGTA
MPAILFGIGGYVGNYWHEYADILVPLFVAARRYHGEVTFLVSNIQHMPRWLVKYRALLQGLSKYGVVDMDRDAYVRCFPRVSVGLRLDKDLSIVPELVPGARLTMADFTRFVRETYALPRGAVTMEPYKKPRLLLIPATRLEHRSRTGAGGPPHHGRLYAVRARDLRAPTRSSDHGAVQEAAAAVDPAGVVVTELRHDGSEVEQARVVNSFDVVLGVHGAGLTNAVHLPPGGVLIQVVPYGKMEPMARFDFSEPATDMGLKYLDYSVSAEESSLLEKLGPDHPAIKDPDSIHRSGWTTMYQFYLMQNVRINTTRFAPTLEQAFNHLRKQ